MLLVILTVLLVWAVRIAYFQRGDVSRGRYPVAGIDVSAHNGAVDFARVAEDSVSFVFIKATEGASFKDRMWEANYAGARAAELAVGAYHFFRFDMNGTMQALNLLQSIEGKRLDLPLVIDVEDDGNPEVSPEMVVVRLEEMISYLEERGETVMLYTNMNGYHKYVRERFSDYPLWICRLAYRPPEEIEWQIWQASHTRRVGGVSGDVDYNVFVGSREAFERSFGSDERCCALSHRCWWSDCLPPPPGWHFCGGVGCPRMSPTPRSAKYGVTHGFNPCRGWGNVRLWSSCDAAHRRRALRCAG